MTAALHDNDILLIVGKSPERWDDVERFWNFGVPFDVCCINETGLIYPCTFKHWFSYHGALLVEQWAPKRPGAMLHTAGPPMSGVRRWRLNNTKGSSSLQAVRCALRFWEYKRVVLAGVSLLGEYAKLFLQHWFEAFGEIGPRTRSLSGNTALILGEPSAAWLEGVQ